MKNLLFPVSVTLLISVICFSIWAWFIYPFSLSYEITPSQYIDWWVMRLISAFIALVLVYICDITIEYFDFDQFKKQIEKSTKLPKKIIKNLIPGVMFLVGIFYLAFLFDGGLATEPESTALIIFLMVFGWIFFFTAIMFVIIGGGFLAVQIDRLKESKKKLKH